MVSSGAMETAWREALEAVGRYGRPVEATAHALADAPWEAVAEVARELRLEGKGTLVTYSPKVFIPLTTLCR
ncbi:MAG: hypothetical protein H0U03_08975, partial [Actinobacteria bacterium]|nr:hypothetical protein [Actinomycetota bacterium]